MINSEKIVT